MKEITFLLIVCISLGCKQNKQQSNKAIESKLALVWSDDFDDEGLPDSNKWSYEIGDGCPDLCGWGNNELQYYSDGQLKNTRVENGRLIIEAHREVKGEMNYTSGKLVTKGNGDWTYGRIEVMAKLPSGVGTWPAIWMLPTDRSTYGSWPTCGEIDIMEHVGYKPDSIFGTIHTEAYNHLQGTQKGGAKEIKTSESSFHKYTLDWDEESIQWFIDDQKYFEFKNENKTHKEWPFDQPFYLILNIAVGGNWGGSEGVDEDIWPQRMEIDYVRVYQ